MTNDLIKPDPEAQPIGFWKNSESPRKSAQIIRMVEQCFAMQDTYGKTDEQLEILMKAMVQDLSEYSESVVTQAFEEWRKTSPKIPTPFNIIKLANKYRTKSVDVMSWQNFEGTWAEYKQYLAEAVNNVK